MKLALGLILFILTPLSMLRCGSNATKNVGLVDADKSFLKLHQGTYNNHLQEGLSIHADGQFAQMLKVPKIEKNSTALTEVDSYCIYELSGKLTNIKYLPKKNKKVNYDWNISGLLSYYGDQPFEYIFDVNYDSKILRQVVRLADGKVQIFKTPEEAKPFVEACEKGMESRNEYQVVREMYSTNMYNKHYREMDKNNWAVVIENGQLVRLPVNPNNYYYYDGIGPDPYVHLKFRNYVTYRYKKTSGLNQQKPSGEKDEFKVSDNFSAQYYSLLAGYRFKSSVEDYDGDTYRGYSYPQVQFDSKQPGFVVKLSPEGTGLNSENCKWQGDFVIKDLAPVISPLLFNAVELQLESDSKPIHGGCLESSTYKVFSEILKAKKAYLLYDYDTQSSTGKKISLYSPDYKNITILLESQKE